MINKQVFDKPELVYEAAAERVVELSKKAISASGRFTIALSGGNTPRKLYELLSTPAYAAAIDWKNSYVFWGDERCVPFSDKDNNSNMAFSALLNNVPVPKENIFPIPVNFEPQRAADSYEQTIMSFFKEPLPHFDLVLLGLGDNGHTASLFPYTAVLKEHDRLVKEVYIEELQKFRISFTARLINAANNILFLVTGSEKSAIIKTVFTGNIDPQRYPVQLINPANSTPAWYLDKQAASLL